MKVLEDQGYACTRAAASLGVVDVVAVRKDGVKLIQIKSNRKPPGPEMEALRSFNITHCPPNGTVEVWVWKDHIREPFIEVL